MTSEALRTPTRAGWWLLAAAVLQVAAPAAQSLADVGQPGDGSDDLLITPAGWTFAIWGAIYLLAIAHAIGTIRSGTGTAEPSRFTRDLLVLYVGAAVWIAFSAVGESWLTAIALLVMLVVAVDAAHVAARPAPAEAPAAQTVLARTAAGLYAGWVSAPRSSISAPPRSSWTCSTVPTPAGRSPCWSPPPRSRWRCCCSGPRCRGTRSPSPGPWWASSSPCGVSPPLPRPSPSSRWS